MPEHPLLSGSVAQLALDFITYCTTERHLTPRTIETYQEIVTWFQTWLAEVAVLPPQATLLRAVTKSHVRSFLARRPFAARTIALNLSVLRKLFDFAQREGSVTGNPPREVDMPKIPDTLPDVLTDGQVTALLDGPLAADWKLSRDRAVLELLFATGIRASEVRALDIRDIDWEGRCIRVRSGKGQKGRVVRIHVRALAALRAYLPLRDRQRLAAAVFNESPGEALFLNYKGARLALFGLRGIVKVRAKQAGVDCRVYLHIVRHTFAAHWYDRGGDPRVLQDVLGHASLKTTGRYGRISVARQVSEYDRVFSPADPDPVSPAHPRAS